jgi:hypothetical protein
MATHAHAKTVCQACKREIKDGEKCETHRARWGNPSEHRLYICSDCLKKPLLVYQPQRVIPYTELNGKLGRKVKPFSLPERKRVRWIESDKALLIRLWKMEQPRLSVKQIREKVFRDSSVNSIIHQISDLRHVGRVGYRNRASGCMMREVKRWGVGKTLERDYSS